MDALLHQDSSFRTLGCIFQVFQTASQMYCRTKVTKVHPQRLKDHWSPSDKVETMQKNKLKSSYWWKFEEIRSQKWAAKACSRAGLHHHRPLLCPSTYISFKWKLSPLAGGIRIHPGVHQPTRVGGGKGGRTGAGSLRYPAPKCRPACRTPFPSSKNDKTTCPPHKKGSISSLVSSYLLAHGQVVDRICPPLRSESMRRAPINGGHQRSALLPAGSSLG